MIKRIAFIGANGTLGKPVVRELVAAGYDVTPLGRATANVFDLAALRRAFAGHDAVYLNLQMSPDERPSDKHAESDGVANVVVAARETGIQRIAMISSLVKNYGGWWAFDVKQRGVDLLRASGLPVTIFYPSSFFENFRAPKVQLAGTSKHRMWFIAGSDYGRQVARSFAMPGNESREYPVQGLEPFTYAEAAKVFAENHPTPVQISSTPMFVLKTLGLFSRPMRNIAKIVEALNEYPETFQSELTWQELGKPQMTLARWSSGVNR